MKRFKYLAFLLWMMPLAFGACTDDDNDEITDEEYIAGAAVVNLTVVDGETDLPIAEVTLKQTALKISETTDANGKATLTFDQAPRAVANLVFSHEAYQDYTTTVAIGEVSEGSTKNVEVKIALNPKTVSYVINFTVLDDSTFLPITGVSILGLETGADITDADGVATVKVPGPGDYTLGLAMTGYDTAYVSAMMPDEGMPGETITVDCGTVMMTVAGGFRIEEVDLSSFTWQLDSMVVWSRDRGTIGSIILSKEQYMAGEGYTVDWDRRSDFGTYDFDYIISASGAVDFRYPLCFKLHYEEASYAPGCYRVEVVKFLEPGDNSVVKDESYYDYKKKKLVLRFLFHEDWCSAEDWDAYYYSAVE